MRGNISDIQGNDIDIAGSIIYTSLGAGLRPVPIRYLTIEINTDATNLPTAHVINIMSKKYKFIDKEGIYFTTSTVVGWVDIFTRDIYRNILLNSLRFCQQNQGLQIHSWVLMTNHLHMICSFKNDFDGGKVLRNIKSFTAMKLLDAIINNPQESRRAWMLDFFEKEGRRNSSNDRFMFWQHENHPVLLDNEFLFNQKFNYLHENPVAAGFVSEPHHWKYSSAVDYYTNQKGLLDILFFE